MNRKVEEWVAAHDDQAIPPRVKVRTFERNDGRCAACTLRIGGKLLPAYDHIVAISNGGHHRESNLQLLCVPCHLVKTKVDVAEKSRVYHKKAKNLGISLKKKTPMPGSKASGWKRKMDGTVVKR